MSSKSHIVVIGAGVTGLTTAAFLAEAGHEVTVVAAHVPGDSSIEYTSPWYAYNEDRVVGHVQEATRMLTFRQGGCTLAYSRHP